MAGDIGARVMTSECDHVRSWVLGFGSRLCFEFPDTKQAPWSAGLPFKLGDPTPSQAGIAATLKGRQREARSRGPGDLRTAFVAWGFEIHRLPTWQMYVVCTWSVDSSLLKASRDEPLSCGRLTFAGARVINDSGLDFLPRP